MKGSEKVAVLGAGGTMGRPIARHLARSGMEVRAWNRTRERAEPLASDGVEVPETPTLAASGATVVLTVLSDTEAVISAMEGPDGALAAAEPGTIWLQMSTIGIGGTEHCATLADEHDLVLVDAPVVGTKKPAEEGKLTVLASGPDEALDRCEPLFDAIGQRSMRLGEAGTGTRMKLVVNSWLLTLVEGLAETISFAEGISIDPEKFLETISGGPIDNPYAQLKGQMMIERRFEPSFKLELAAKDAGLLLEAARRHGLDLPLFDVIEARLDDAAIQHGEQDMAATYLESAPKLPAGR